MRVAYFHAYPDGTGAARMTEEEAVELARRGHDVTVLCPVHGALIARLHERGVAAEVVPAPAPWRAYGGALLSPRGAVAALTLPGYWRDVRRVVERLGAEVVHAVDHRAMLLAAPGARRAGAAVVWHVQGAFASRFLDRVCARLADRIVVASAGMLEFSPVLGAQGERVALIPNSLPAAPDPALRAPRAGARPLIVCGARLHPDKGLGVLIDATALLRDSGRRVDVQIAGPALPGGAHAAELERRRATLGLDDDVTFLGRVDDPLALWGTADVYVQPSRREPFGIAVLEALALGVPVVASDVGGLRDLVADEQGGLLVAPDDAAALATAIARVLDEPGLAARLADRGREHAGRFTLAATVDGVEAVQADALARRRGASGAAVAA